MKLTRKQYKTNFILSLVLMFSLILFFKVPTASAVILSQLMCLQWCFVDLFVESKDDE